jgi:hypothetical protein
MLHTKQSTVPRIAKRLTMVLDANAFYDDPNLTGTDSKLLGEYVNSGRAEIAVPRVVFDEVVKKFRERLEDHVQEIKSANRKLIWLTEQSYKAEWPSVDFKREQQNYKRRLESRLAKWGASILPYPNISHEKLAARDLAKRKPFSEGGRGYRDGLIWESILESLDLAGKYVLLTANHKDFCREGDVRSLHEHLLEDLRTKSFSGSFVVRRKIEDVLDEFIKPTLARADRVKHDLQRARYALLDIWKLLTDKFESVVDGARERLWLEFPNVDLDEPYGISGLYDADEIEVKDVIELSDGELYIEIGVQYEADVFAYIYKSDVYSLRDDFPLEVTDWDWNEHYAEVTGTITLSLSIEIMFNPKSKRITSFEVREARNRPETDPNDGEPLS